MQALHVAAAVLTADRLRRFATTVALACCVLACRTTAPPGEPVELLTGVMPFDEDECSPNGYVAVLLVDPQYGTTLAGAYGERYPVMWQPGFTGRRVGFEVVVVDPDGNLVATTGQSYRISGNVLVQAPTGGWPNREDHPYRRGWVNSSIGPDMYYACKDVAAQATQEPFLWDWQK